MSSSPVSENKPNAGPKETGAGPRRRSKSMHDGIAVWCDCCSCEMEPYWAEVAAEMGLSPGSDYEDEADGH